MTTAARGGGKERERSEDRRGGPISFVVAYVNNNSARIDNGGIRSHFVIPIKADKETCVSTAHIPPSQLRSGWITVTWACKLLRWSSTGYSIDHSPLST